MEAAGFSAPGLTELNSRCQLIEGLRWNHEVYSQKKPFPSSSRLSAENLVPCCRTEVPLSLLSAKSHTQLLKATCILCHLVPIFKLACPVLLRLQISQTFSSVVSLLPARESYLLLRGHVIKLELPGKFMIFNICNLNDICKVPLAR